MTLQEHQIHVLILGRVYQALRAVTTALESREILTADDLKAFHFATWDDNQQIFALAAQARTDYLKIAKSAGVEVPPGI